MDGKKRLDKIYLCEGDLYSLKFYRFGGGSEELAILPGSLLCLTNYKIPKPKFPPEKISVLRRTLDGTVIERTYQRGFDRILVMEGNCGEEEVRIIVEVFGEGNIIFEKGGKIIYAHKKGSWRHREISLGIKYEFPPSTPDPRSISAKEAKDIISKYKDLVRGLARGLGLGGELAEEVCLRAGIEKEKKPKEVKEEEIERILEEIRKIILEAERSSKGYAYFERGELISISPIKMKIYEDKEVKEYESLHEAIEENLLVPILAGKREIEKEKRKIREKYERILSEQLEAMKRLKERSGILRDAANAIYSNMSFYQTLFEEVKRAFEEGTLEDLRKEGKISGYDSKRRTFRFFVRELGKEVEFSLDLNFFQNVNSLYEKAKESERKAEELKRRIEETRKRMERELKIKEREVEEKKREKKFWFEKYKWFISSSGFLVVAGKDAKSNEEVVKRYLGEKDLYAHAEVHGAPSVVIISGGKEIDEETKREACEFAAIHSRAWGRLHQIDAYWVYPTQVTKTPNPGEYLPKGAFVIRGKRNYFHRIEMKGGIGAVEIEGVEKLMFGPVSAVKSRCKDYLIVIPGEIPKEKFAKAVAEAYSSDPSYVASILPPGGFRIIEVRGERAKRVLEILGEKVEGRIRGQEKEGDEGNPGKRGRLMAPL